MIELRSEDILHKSYLHRVLMEIVDQPRAAQALAFKGGSCAAMLGYLDRFSVDLDFDVLQGANEEAAEESISPGLRAAGSASDIRVRQGALLPATLPEQPREGAARSR